MITDIETLSSLEKLNLIDISYSRLDTYSTCHAKYFFSYVEKVERGFAPAAALGNALHGTLEHCAGEEEFNLLDMTKTFEQQRRVYDPEHLISEQLIDDGFMMLHEFHARHEGEQFDIIGKEVPFRMIIGSALISGYIDRVDRTSSGITVIDWKSGKMQVADKDVATNLQLGIYALAMSQRFPGETIRAELYYLRNGKVKGHTYSKADLEAVEELVIENVNQLIHDQNFKYTDNVRNCFWCDYAKNGTCKVGAGRSRSRR